MSITGTPSSIQSSSGDGGFSVMADCDADKFCEVGSDDDDVTLFSRRETRANNYGFPTVGALDRRVGVADLTT
jgi:hypothetical protein